MESQLKPPTSPFRAEAYPTLYAIVRSLDGGAEKSLADEVGREILTRIIRGDVAEGARLKSTVLARELGVSRTPVAKALAKLTTDGILLQPNNHQAEVAPGAANWLIQIHELRQILEPEAAARAAGNVSEPVLAELTELAEASLPTDPPTWPMLAQFFDFGLHLAIADSCGNLPMTVSIRKCWSYKKLSYDLSGGCAPNLHREHDLHLQILDALRNGDALDARRCMTEHLTRAVDNRYSERVV